MRDRNIPVYIMYYKGANKNRVNAVKAGIMELLQIADATSKVRVHDFGAWKHPNWKTNGQLMPYGSMDWYLEQGRVEGRNQLYAGAILGAICREPWQNTTPHYDVVVTSKDMFELGTNFVLGTAYPGTGTVLSTARRGKFPADEQFELIKTEVMHEVGHVFNLPNRNRSDIEQKLGGHCLNDCVMRQGMTVPHDWIDITNDRLEFGALCPTCVNDLRNFFN